MSNVERLITDKAWWARAKCRETEYSSLFSKMFDSDARANMTNRAKRICMECPVNVECYKSALANDEKWGVWGGVNFARRNTIIIQRTKFDMDLRYRKRRKARKGTKA